MSTATKIRVIFKDHNPLEILRPSKTTIESLKHILRDEFAV